MLLDAIYEQAGCAKNAAGCWKPNSIHYRYLTNRIHKNKIVVEELSKLSDIGFDSWYDTAIWPKNEGFSIIMSSKISDEVLASFHINDSISIGIYNCETGDHYTIEQFFAKFPDYISKLPAPNYDITRTLFARLPQPIAEELAEYYPAIFLAR